MNNIKSNHLPPKTSWNEKKTKLIALYPQITDEDFQYEIGKKDVMLNKLAAKIGKHRDELEIILSGL